MLEFCHECELLGAEIRAVRREIHLFIPAQQAVHRAEHVGAFESRNEFCTGGFSCHAAIEPKPQPCASAFAPLIVCPVQENARTRSIVR